MYFYFKMAYDDATQTIKKIEPRSVLVLIEKGEYATRLETRLKTLTQECSGRYTFEITNDSYGAMREAIKYNAFMVVAPVSYFSRMNLDFICGVVENLLNKPPVLVVTDSTTKNSKRSPDEAKRIVFKDKACDLYGDLKRSTVISTEAMENGLIKELDDVFNDKNAEDHLENPTEEKTPQQLENK